MRIQHNIYNYVYKQLITLRSAIRLAKTSVDNSEVISEHAKNHQTMNVNHDYDNQDSHLNLTGIWFTFNVKDTKGEPTRHSLDSLLGGTHNKNG